MGMISMSSGRTPAFDTVDQAFGFQSSEEFQIWSPRVETTVKCPVDLTDATRLCSYVQGLPRQPSVEV